MHQHYYNVSGVVDFNHPNSRDMRVYLDGVEQKHCTSARSGRDGYVTRYKMLENGEPDKTLTVEPDVEVVQGHVEIRRLVGDLTASHHRGYSHIMKKESKYASQT
jgi:hypothetical protein